MSKKIKKGHLCQWSTGTGGVYYPCSTTVDSLEAGMYEIRYSQSRGTFVVKQDVDLDDLINLPIRQSREVLKDISTFWEREEAFKKYGYVQKRGILLYGPPGGGKSCLIQLLCQNLVKEKDGIVFNLKDGDDISLYIEFASEMFRIIEPNRPIIVLIEDIDDLVVGSARHVLTKVLNLLDGVKQINKVVYLATTNYPERLEERISNRSSRFDRRYRIGYPTQAVRETYLKAKLKEEDLKSIDLKEWVKETKGMTLAHIKELIISVFLLGNTFEFSLKKLTDMKKKASSDEDAKERGDRKKIGFTEDKEEEYDDEDDCKEDELVGRDKTEVVEIEDTEEGQL